MKLFQLLNGNNYLTINRPLAHEIGLNAALMLSEIIDKYTYFEKKGALDEDGWFYLTVDTVEERTTLAKDAQVGAIKILKEEGLIECKQKGMPAKRHFRVIQEKFAERWNPANKKEETRQHDRGNSENMIEELSTPAPYRREKTKEETKSVCSSDEPNIGKNGDVVIKKTPKGDVIQTTLEKIVQESILLSKDWTLPEIREGWKRLKESNELISTFSGWMDGTIKNIRNEKKGKSYSKAKGRKQCTQPQTQKNESTTSKGNSSADVTQEHPSLQSLLEKEGMM